MRALTTTADVRALTTNERRSIVCNVAPKSEFVHTYIIDTLIVITPVLDIGVGAT